MGRTGRAGAKGRGLLLLHDFERGEADHYGLCFDGYVNNMSGQVLARLVMLKNLDMQAEQNRHTMALVVQFLRTQGVERPSTDSKCSCWSANGDFHSTCQSVVQTYSRVLVFQAKPIDNLKT